MIKHIIFDLDGTLCDLVDAHFITLNKSIANIAGNEFTISLEEQNSIYNGLSTRTKLNKLVLSKNLNPDYIEDINKLKQKYTIDYINNNIHIDKRLINELLQLKHQGYTLHCASNAMYETVILALTRLGIKSLFDIIIGNNSIKRQKPYPDIYLQCFLMIPADPSECLIVEDSRHGRESALRSGAYLFDVDNPTQITYSGIYDFINKIDSDQQPYLPFYGKNTLNVLIVAAGAGARLRAKWHLPKPLIDIAGKTMIQRVVETINIEANYIFIVQKEHYDKYNLGAYLKLIVPNCTIITTDGLTQGAACTSLLAKEYIDNDKHLLIANSDQLLDWDPSDFMFKMLSSGVDGGILTFEKENDPKWSYVKLDNQGYVTEVVEKKPISNLATIGLYYFNRGSDYVSATEEMIAADDRVNNEYYLAPAYNYMIKKGKKIITHNIDGDKFFPTGTIEDLENVLNNYKF